MFEFDKYIVGFILYMIKLEYKCSYCVNRNPVFMDNCEAILAKYLLMQVTVAKFIHIIGNDTSNFNKTRVKESFLFPEHSI